MLAVSTGFEHNKVPGIEAPHLVLEDVIKLEKQAMRKKIRYLEFFTHKAAEQKEKAGGGAEGEEGGGGGRRRRREGVTKQRRDISGHVSAIVSRKVKAKRAKQRATST